MKFNDPPHICTSPAPILFSMMVSDLVSTWPKCAKYVDDLTILEIIPRDSPSYLNCIVNDIQCFSHCNNMHLSPAKCKAMTIDFLDYNSCTWRPICTGGVVIECVKSFKLFVVYSSEDLTWGVHCDYIIKKANCRLYALRTLKKCGVPTSDLITVYCSQTIQPCVWPCHEWKGNYHSLLFVTKLPEL